MLCWFSQIGSLIFFFMLCDDSQPIKETDSNTLKSSKNKELVCQLVYSPKLQFLVIVFLYVGKHMLIVNIIIELWQDKQVGPQSMEMLKIRASLEEKLRQKGIFSSITPKIGKTREHLQPLNRYSFSIQFYASSFVYSN